MSIRTQNCILQLDLIKVRSGIFEPLPKLFYELRYSPDQPRDEQGRFTFGSGGGSSGKGVDKSGNSLYNDSKDESSADIIDKSPQLNYFNDPELNSAVQNAADDILNTIRVRPNGTEAAKVISLSEPNRSSNVILGKDGEMTVNIPRCTEPSIILHNHPSGQTFSNEDIDRFVIDKNARCMCVIGNNGRWYVLEKSNNFDYLDFFHKAKPAYKSKKLAKTVLGGAENYGFKYYES